MAETSLLTGTGRLKIMREDIACWRIKLLDHHVPVIARTSRVDIDIVPEYTCIGGESGNCNADMIVYSEHLLLV